MISSHFYSHSARRHEPREGERKSTENARQARSKATVDAIITAAAHILIERGYEGATTGRIAERAGVSIGSLYQYFPNKEALVAALIEGHANEIVSVIEAALDDPALATVADGIRALIKAGMVAHRIDPALHKILNEQVPRVGRLAKAMDTSRRITKAIERFLRAHADELDPGCDPAVAAVVVETTVEALAHKALAERRAMLTNGRLERETFRLATRYLSPS